MAVIQTETNVKRQETERKLASYQRKKGAVLLGSLNMTIQSGAVVAFRVVDHYDVKKVEEDVEEENSEGEIEIITKIIDKEIPIHVWKW
jgi:hypothetical protein